MLNKQQCDEIREIIMPHVRAALKNHPNFKDLIVKSGGGRFSSAEFCMKILFQPQTIAAPQTAEFGQELTDDKVRQGYAKPGTPILYSGGKKGVVIKARTKKYLFRDVESGREYIIGFMACSLDKTALAAAKG